METIHLSIPALSSSGFDASATITQVANQLKAADISPIVDGVVAMLPFIIGATLVGIAIRKLLGYFRKGARAI